MYWKRNIIVIGMGAILYLLLAMAFSKLFEHYLMQYESLITVFAVINQAILGLVGGILIATLIKAPQPSYYLLALVLPIISSALGWYDLSSQPEYRPPFITYASIVSFQYIFCVIGAYLIYFIKRGKTANA